MFKLLSAITIAAVIMISTLAKSAIFTMPINLVCDDAKDISNWIDEEGYVLVASGLTKTAKGEIFVGVYSHKENLVVIGVDPEGYACFVVEINEALEWEFDMKKNLPEPADKGPKIPS
tara:strand:- start:1846 stop:2199 length:354 start_codon:yes stop_codon:yes gene_type:complete